MLFECHLSNYERDTGPTKNEDQVQIVHTAPDPTSTFL